MAEFETGSSPRRKCSRCHADLPAGVNEELCPKCLLEAGLATQPIEPMTKAAPATEPVRSRGLPQPGEQFGHYRIIRSLGEGGMGAVFEAEDQASGRRVALKVLSQKLDAPDARTRFLREGRLAASINHPNSVYVFGTEEIAGTPVIAMELVSGGTLQEWVNSRGPMPVGEAVDCALQIIAGLEAAQRIGILHRDVKPSNCFRDTDGTVKIGDFGLSISTTVRTEPTLTATGAFLGTPAFCSPEQLRGDELNARSDMYSVGATLFYLLTGRTPFDGKNTVQLLATVLEQHAPSPRKFRAEIQQGLAKVILRCLEKQPTDRSKDYAELSLALAPYSSTAPTPATLGLRLLAGTLDQTAFGLVGFVLMMAVMGDPMGFMNATVNQSPATFAMMLGGLIIGVGYFAVMEGLWGFTLGKAICRLRVVKSDRSLPGVWRALGRAVAYIALPALPYWAVLWLAFGGDPKLYLNGPKVVQYLMSASFIIVVALLFCTARRRNGFAAIHDLLTGTRVIARMAMPTRQIFPVSETPPVAVESNHRVGPYYVLETLEDAGEMKWLLGYDLRLLRKVWLRVVPPGTPPIPSGLRNLGRVGRLRWLAGRRSPEENWDAFEAVSGKPLLTLAQQNQPWSQVRFWLFDLANEISVAEKENTLPSELALDRVWITTDGRAKLLDFPAPSLHREAGIQTEELPAAASHPSQRVQRFLSEIATTALTGQERVVIEPSGDLELRLPLHARHFLKRLPELVDARAAARTLQPLLSRVAEVTRLRRAIIVGSCLGFPFLLSCGMLLGISMLKQWNARNPGLLELSTLLHQRDAMNRWLKHQPHPTDQQFAIYIAHHYRSAVTNDAEWTDFFALSLINGDNRRFAEQSVTDHPAPTAKEIADADTALKPLSLRDNGLDFLRKPWLPLVMFGGTLVIYVGLPALIAALLFRGGLILLATGVTFVRRDGARASRLRVFWRSLLAWSPLLAMPFAFGILSPLLGKAAAGATLALCACGLTVVSLTLKDRGLPDRLAGTWPVPR